MPTGTLKIEAGNTKIKLNQRKATGAVSGSKTVGASAAPNGLSSSRPAPQAPSSNTNNSTLHDRRPPLQDPVEAEDDRRIMSNAGATMPRSILRNEARKHAAEEAVAGAADEEDSVPLGEDAASMNQRLMLRRQSASDLSPSLRKHTPIHHQPDPTRKHSSPVAPLQIQSQWQRQQQMQHQQSLDSPRSFASSNNSNPSFGSPAAMHTSTSSPSFGSSPSPSAARHRPTSAPMAPAKMFHRPPSSTGSASNISDNDNVFSGLAPPVDIPAPDYNEAPPLPVKSAAATRPPMTHWNSVPERAEPPSNHLDQRPPSPPPISTIPTRQTQSSMPTRNAPTPPSSTGGSSPPPPPPPPGVPAPPAAPPPPGVPAPPGPPPPPGAGGAPPPPAPPPPPVDSAPAGGAGGLAASIANAKLKPASERAERPPPPKEESPMDNMMKELRRVQERRKSMGDGLANNDAVEKMSTGSSGSGSEQTELEKALNRRKLGTFNAGPRTPPNPLPKSTTPKSRFNANNSPARNNFRVNNNINNVGSQNIQAMSDVPNDLKCLTMNQVIQVLKLLKLGQYEARFKEHCIDGDMLATLTREMLKNDLGITSQLDLNKLEKFINGWRPK